MQKGYVTCQRPGSQNAKLSLPNSRTVLLALNSIFFTVCSAYDKTDNKLASHLISRVSVFSHVHTEVA